MPKPNAMASRIPKWYWFVACTVWALILGVSLVASVSERPFNIPIVARSSLIAIAPQGWGFFTRNPREPVLGVFRRRNGVWREFSLRVGQAKYLFGLNRRARLYSLEIGEILPAIPLDHWHPCAEEAQDCLNKLPLPEAPISVPRRVPIDKALCGTLALQLSEKLPWVWSSQRGSDSSRTQVS